MKLCVICDRVGPTTRCPEHRLRRRGHQDRQLRAIVLAEETRCHYCQQPARPGDPFEMAHIIARARGGPLVRSNVAAAHRSCNRREGTGTPPLGHHQPRGAPPAQLPVHLASCTGSGDVL